MRPRHAPALVARVAAIPARLRHTSSVTIGEIVYGAHRIPAPRDGLLALLASVLPQVTVLPFDEAAARIYGELRARLEAAGTPLHEADLRIASVALANDLTLVTRNTRHFDRVP